MAKSAAVVACAVGVVAMLLVGSAAFTVGFQAAAPPAGAGARQHMGRSPAPEAGMGATTASLSIGVAAGLAAAALAAATRGVVVRRAEGEEIVKDEPRRNFRRQGKIIQRAQEAFAEREEKSKLAKIPLPSGCSEWVEPDPEFLFLSGGPSVGPIAFWNEGAIFAGGIVGSEYHGWGKYEFDPLGLANRYPEHLPWYREAELKHGRVAMLACVGLIAPDGFRIPIDACSSPDLDMLTSHNKLIGPGLGEGPMWYLLIFCGIIESIRFKQVGLGFGELTLENAGDLNFGKGFLPSTKEGQIQMKIKELKNGRLAMLAFSGAITQGILWETHHFPFVPTS